MQPITKTGVITGLERLSGTDTFLPHSGTRTTRRDAATAARSLESRDPNVARRNDRYRSARQRQRLHVLRATSAGRHARPVRRPRPRILPCPSRRNANAASGCEAASARRSPFITFATNQSLRPVQPCLAGQGDGEARRVFVRVARRADELEFARPPMKPPPLDPDVADTAPSSAVTNTVI